MKKTLFHFLLFFLFYSKTIHFVKTSQPTPDEEIDVLKELYSVTNGRDWNRNRGWDQGDPCLDEWFGILCTVGAENDPTHILNITLIQNNLFGNISFDWSPLNFIIEVNLRQNRITEQIPDFPPALQFLDLSSNLFEGSLPPSILQSNSLRGLSLAQNSLNGTIGDIFTPDTMKNVQTISLAINQIRGNVDEAQFSLSAKISTLELYQNNLTGTLTPEIFQLPRLTYLDLSDNVEITGDVPLNVGASPLLKTLRFNNLRLTGSLDPFALKKPDHWTSLELQGNKFVGPVQEILVNGELNLYGNELSGTLSNWICAIPTFDVRSNDLDCPFPTCCGPCEDPPIGLGKHCCPTDCSGTSFFSSTLGIVTMVMGGLALVLFLSLLFVLFFWKERPKILKPRPPSEKTPLKYYEGFIRNSVDEEGPLCIHAVNESPNQRRNMHYRDSLADPDSDFDIRTSSLGSSELSEEASISSAFESWRNKKEKNSSGPPSSDSKKRDPLKASQDDLEMQPNWLIDRNDLTLGKQVGMGSFGVVYKGEWGQGVVVAVKALHAETVSAVGLSSNWEERSEGDQAKFLELKREVLLLSTLNHPNIVRFYGCVVSPPDFYLVTEWISRGNLFKLIHDSSTRFMQLNLALRLRLAYGAAKGLCYLHSLPTPVVHRDIKSTNLLVDEQWNVKVADFGLSQVQVGSLHSMVGTPAWVASEVLQGLPYTTAADVHSFGVVLWEILTSHVPYRGKTGYQILSMVMRRQLLDIPEDIHPECIALVKSCWLVSSNRPPMLEVCQKLEEIIRVLSEEREVEPTLSNQRKNSRDDPLKSKNLFLYGQILLAREKALQTRQGRVSTSSSPSTTPSPTGPKIDYSDPEREQDRISPLDQEKFGGYERGSFRASGHLTEPTIAAPLIESGSIKPQHRSLPSNSMTQKQFKEKDDLKRGEETEAFGYDALLSNGGVAMTGSDQGLSLAGQIVRSSGSEQQRESPRTQQQSPSSALPQSSAPSPSSAFSQSSAPSPSSAFPQSSVPSQSPAFPQSSTISPSSAFSQSSTTSPSPAFPQSSVPSQSPAFPQSSTISPSSAFPQSSAHSWFPQSSALPQSSVPPQHPVVPLSQSSTLPQSSVPPQRTTLSQSATLPLSSAQPQSPSSIPPESSSVAPQPVFLPPPSALAITQDIFADPSKGPRFANDLLVGKKNEGGETTEEDPGAYEEHFILDSEDSSSDDESGYPGSSGFKRENRRSSRHETPPPLPGSSPYSNGSFQGSGYLDDLSSRTQEEIEQMKKDVMKNLLIG